uniref:Early protein E5-BETA n=1 Tax=Human papillomavirus type 2 TaxID=333751 RepID=A0A8E4N440_9PAPI|nr:early protein E5-BETA [Human papillomavirus type 2]
MYPVVYKGSEGTYPVVLWGHDDVQCLLVILILIAFLLLMFYVRLLNHT